MQNNRKNRLKDEWMNLTQSIAEIYYTLHLIDLRDYTFEEYVGENLRERVSIFNNDDAIEVFTTIVKHSVSKDFLEAALEFTDFTTLAERLREKKTIFMDVIDVNEGWLRLTFITKETDDNSRPTKVIFTTQHISDDKEREKELLIKLNNDELTGVLNRRAYENDLLSWPEIPVEKDFVYASIDVNGLKTVNDTKGHAAGDELIKGTAACLKQAFGNYGRIYRTGGDEFVVLFFAEEQRIADIMHDLRSLEAEWHGNLIDELSFSIGYASKREFPTESVRELADIADKRMYENKKKYYADNGIERRAKVSAYVVIGDLYTKILKCNLTSDSYTIIKIDNDNDIVAPEKLSEYLINLGKAGLVNTDDLPDYLKNTDLDFLRNYFNQGKELLSLIYRRKCNEEYKNVIMELVRANDYTSENQSLYIYVKQIATI